MEQWYALHTKSNAEYRVAAALEHRDVSTFLPEINTSGGARKKPLFPGYLFSKIDFKAISLSQLEWTPGLRGIVSIGGHPVPLPSDVMELIMRRVKNNSLVEREARSKFKPGDVVRITGGPFQAMEAIFEGSTPPSERVQVLLHILGRASRLEISVAHLEKAPADAERDHRKQRRTRGAGRRIRYT